MGLSARVWRYVLVLGSGAVVAYLTVPGATGTDALYQAFGIGSVLCVVIGVRLHRPADRIGWYLLALGLTADCAGDFLARADGLAYRTGHAGLSASYGAYLAGYLLVFAAILRLGRDPNRGRRREDRADAAIVTLGALAVSWHFLMSPLARDASLTTPDRLAALSCLILDIGLVFVVCTSLFFGRRGRQSGRILGAGLLVMAATDFATGVLVLHHVAAGRAAAGFLISSLLLAVAALHPSMSETIPVTPRSVPNVYRRETTGRRRIPAVALAGFVPPTVLLVAGALDEPTDVAMMAALCIAVFALINLRMMWLIGQMTGQTNEIEGHARALEASHRQRDALETDLRHLAFHDELTGLANRALLHDRVAHALAAAPRTGHSVALCFGDLDGFKTVNDTLGHHVGDNVLVRASRLLTSIVRPGDTVARLGGDEFAVLLVDIDHPDAAVDFARRIVAVLRDAPDFEGNEIGLSISVGVAYGEAGKSSEQLLSEADSAMYEAKERGKNCVAVFQPSMRSRMLERLDLTNGFRWALGRSEFFLQYQPIVSLSDSRLRGFEALVRWGHPTLGEVEPLRFIPIAEETGFIVPLGRWVLVEACEQLAAWTTRPGDELSLSVNLSRRQLMSSHLADEVRTALALSGLDPHRLILEVTESVLMQDPERAVEALSELRTMGTRIAVDDFGTGYSSLSHLQRFPVDVLKIDKSFIDPLMGGDTASSALVTAIIGLAASLGLEVIAEGIEHESQLHRLVDLGCAQGQGFLMSRPLHGAEAGLLVAGRAGVPVPG